MNSKIIKLDEEIKDLNNKIFEQALKRSETISDTTDKILIQLYETLWFWINLISILISLLITILTSN